LSLKGRGLISIKLVISDAHEGLKAASPDPSGPAPPANPPGTARNRPQPPAAQQITRRRQRLQSLLRIKEPGLSRHHRLPLPQDQ
jgi:hypothetical protein